MLEPISLPILVRGEETGGTDTAMAFTFHFFVPGSTMNQVRFRSTAE
jgi:hypothetical protein